MHALNLPNALTVLRILMVPALVVVLGQDSSSGDLVGALIFAAASITDAIDGRLARARDDITTFGKLADPLADKLLIAAALITLVAIDRLAVWVAVVIIVREVVVTVSRIAVTQHGHVMAASGWGKIKTIVQSLCVLAVIAFSSTPLWLDLLVDVTVAITIISGVDFFVARRRLLRAEPSPARVHDGQTSRRPVL